MVESRAKVKVRKKNFFLRLEELRIEEAFDVKKMMEFRTFGFKIWRLVKKTSGDLKIGSSFLPFFKNSGQCWWFTQMSMELEVMSSKKV